MVSLSELPVLHSNDSSTHGLVARVRRICMCCKLKGYETKGVSKVYKSYFEVKAWRYSISADYPEIAVLLVGADLPIEKDEGERWVMLEDPHKKYEDVNMSILATLHCLWFFKRKPEESLESLLDYLCAVFRSYHTMPSVEDLIQNIEFIREATINDKTLTNCKFLESFLTNPEKWNPPKLLQQLLRQQERVQLRQLQKHEQVVQEFVTLHMQTQAVNSELQNTIKHLEGLQVALKSKGVLNQRGQVRDAKHENGVLNPRDQDKLLRPLATLYIGFLGAVIAKPGLSNNLIYILASALLFLSSILVYYLSLRNNKDVEDPREGRFRRFCRRFCCEGVFTSLFIMLIPFFPSGFMGWCVLGLVCVFIWLCS